MSDADKISQSGILDVGVSDHCMIYCTRKLVKFTFNKHKSVKNQIHEKLQKRGVPNKSTQCRLVFSYLLGQCDDLFFFFNSFFFYYSQFVSIHKIFTSLSENIMLYFVNVYVLCIYYTYTSRKHLRTEVSPDLHPNYSKKGGNLGSESK